MTRPNSLARWRRVPRVFDAVRSAVGGSEELLLFTDSPEGEIAEFEAAAWAFERCGGRLERLFAATPCPDADWVAAVRRSGVRTVFVARPGRTGIDVEREVPAVICPLLRARRGSEATLSVCGGHADRRVLAASHRAKWCLGEFERCPSIRRSRA